MHSPTINWWPGCLAFGESEGAFLSRFCLLNGINAQKFNAYFGFGRLLSNHHSEDLITRVSELLGEPLEVVRSVLSPIKFSSSPAMSWLADKGIKQVKYCENCIESGFHSPWHQLHWMEVCPQHLTPLLTRRISSSGDYPSRYIRELNELGQKHSKHWPYSAISSFSDETHERLLVLSDWAKTASLAYAEFTRGHLWKSGDLRESFSKLNALVQMPKTVRNLLPSTDFSLRTASKSYDSKCNSEDGNLKQHSLYFSESFIFFKRICGALLGPQRCARHFLSLISSLEDRHGKCNCRWHLRNSGWRQVWIENDLVEGIPFWSAGCPYSSAMDEMKEMFFVQDRKRFLIENMLHLADECKAHLETGLCLRDQKKSVPDIWQHMLTPWPGYAWNQRSSLTDVFNDAVIFEIDTLYKSLIKWINDIENGAPPHILPNRTECILAAEENNSLHLRMWVGEGYEFKSGRRSYRRKASTS